MIDLKLPEGFRAAGVRCGIKKPEKKELALVVSDKPCAGAGFYTRNRFAAPPIEICRRHLADFSPRAVVINSGCANACTGDRGFSDALESARAVAMSVGCRSEEVLVASTGVIGQFLPMDKIEKGIVDATKQLSKDAPSWNDAAEAIMTTDTFPKTASLRVEIQGKPVTILGMAKGSGMIHPDLATMLGFIFSDAAIEPEALRMAGESAVTNSFNRVTVDGDTSTNDTVLFLANGMAENRRIEADGTDYDVFLEALTEVCKTLARMIAKDGEGATRLIEVRVSGAKSNEDAKKTAEAVATSNLVKTAIFGRDANWGRIVCAVGYSGADFEPDKITVKVGSELIFSGGAPRITSEERLNKILEKDEVDINIDLAAGEASTVMWTCDLTYDYVKINAEYRT